jgi:hypothetical protein
MDFADTYGLWADSHVFYNNPIRRTTDRDPVADKLAAWDVRMATGTPNGGLLAHNRMFEMLRADERVSLLHVTHALEEITERGVLYPSGGCLVGSVYCTPLAKSGDGYRVHNLGSYVLTREAPLAGRNGHALAAPTPLVIDIRLPASAFRGVVGIDYLRLGTIHLGIYQHLEYLLARAERHQLRDTVVNRIKNAMAFLGTCVAVCFDETRPDPARFLDQLVHAVSQLPILGYIYFEVLAEYLMLHSTGPRAIDLKRRGEFDNWPYKELLFGTFPAMAGKFDLARFRPSTSHLARVVPEVDATLDLAHLMTYTADRVALLVCARLLSPALHAADWSRLRWEFDALTPYAGPLLGHLIHRELRTFGRYPDFYFYFDQYKALQAWNYWNYMDIVLPFNATLPKGEIGINPAYPSLEHRVHRAELTTDGLLVPVEQLDVSIAPRLVDLRYTLMRGRSSEQGTKLAA